MNNMKKLLILFIVILWYLNFTYWVVVNNLSSHTVACPEANVDAHFYIPGNNLTIYPLDNFRADKLSFIRAWESTVWVWRNSPTSIDPTSCNNWYRVSNVAPWDNNFYVALWTAWCVLNKTPKTNSALPDAQIVYNIAFKNQVWTWSWLSSYFSFRFFWENNIWPITNLTDQTTRTWWPLTMHGNECFNIYSHWCGDWILDNTYGEQCDDSNSTSGDGCSATCLTEWSGSSWWSSWWGGGWSSWWGSSGGWSSSSGSSWWSSSWWNGGWWDWTIFSDTPNCEYVDPPSVQIWEYLPIWWKLKTWIWTDTCNWSNSWKYNKATAKCHFEISNWLSEKDTFSKDCFVNNWTSLAQWFVNDFAVSMKYDGRITYLINPDKYKWLWEYKIKLKKVEYQVCDWSNWTNWSYDNTICEMNFAVTRPYLLQRWSTLSTVNNDVLANFYAINGTPIVPASQLQNITVSSYNWWENLSYILSDFISKYEKLAVKPEWSVDMNIMVDVKKVPDKDIYIMDAWWKTIQIKSNANLSKPSTLIVKNWNIKIRDDSNWNWMYIVPDGKIYFETNNCDLQQQVDGIYIAKSFDTDLVINNDNSKTNWCKDWRLKINWLLIWEDSNNVWSKRRSVILNYFNTSNPTQKLDKIYNWASCLIQTNTNIWIDLPPGADELMSKLQIKKN